MRRFRDFFNEAARLPFVAGTQHSGHFDLPDLRNLHDPTDRPEGGWTSFQQIARANTQSMQMQSSDDYVLRNTLENVRALAENVMSAIILRRTSGTAIKANHLEKNYNNAQFDNTRMMLTGLTKNEIIGGDYPRLRNEDMLRAERLRIIVPIGNGFWAIDIRQLRSEMEKLRERLRKQEGMYSLVHGAAGAADQALARMLTPSGKIPDFTRAQT